MTCIYQITTGEDTYIGSTKDYKSRAYHHKHCIFKRNDKNQKLYKVIRENNGEYNMELLYVLNDDEQQYIVEREWYDKIKPTLNSLKPYVTEEEAKAYQSTWTKTAAVKNKEHIKGVKTVYYNKNKEYFKKQGQLYRDDNKEHISLNKKRYYLENKEKILNYKSTKVTCECGSVLTKGNLLTHKKTYKHKSYMLNLKS